MMCAAFGPEQHTISVQKQLSRTETAFTYHHPATLELIVIPSGITMCTMLSMQSIHEQTMTQDSSVVEPRWVKSFHPQYF